MRPRCRSSSDDGICAWISRSAARSTRLWTARPPVCRSIAVHLPDLRRLGAEISASVNTTHRPVHPADSLDRRRRRRDLHRPRRRSRSASAQRHGASLGGPSTDRPAARAHPRSWPCSTPWACFPMASRSSTKVSPARCSAAARCTARSSATSRRSSRKSKARPGSPANTRSFSMMTIRFERGQFLIVLRFKGFGKFNGLRGLFDRFDRFCGSTSSRFALLRERGTACVRIPLR